MILVLGTGVAAARESRGGEDGVSLRAQQREHERERYGEMAREALEEEIRQAISLLQSEHASLDPSLEAEVRMRLAVAYGEMARYRWFAAMETFEIDQEACFERGDEGCEALAPDLHGTHGFAHQALATYRALLAGYPDFPRSDEVRFRLGMIQEDVGEREKAVQTYAELIEHHPGSAYLADAYYAIGEHHFDESNPHQAAAAFRAAAAVRDSDVAVFALYKLAWCHFNLGQIDTAVETMAQVFEVSRRATSAGPLAPITLEEEALRDLVRFLAETGDPESALVIVRRYGDRATIRPLIWQLGQGYLEIGQPELAIRALRQLLLDDPMAPDSPLVQAAITDAFRSRDDLGRALAAVDQLVDGYGPNSAWSRANADDDAALSEAADRIERTLRRAAVDTHEMGMKRGDRELLAAAADHYATYLELYPDVLGAYGVRYWYAEALFDLGRYDRAADEYERVVALDPQGKHVHQAAWNAIVAIERQLEVIQTR